jgi:glucose-6-phosphate isomerase
MNNYKLFFKKKDFDQTKLLEELKKEKNQGVSGYYKLPFDLKLLEEVEEFKKEIDKEFENIVVIGIGGSLLGTKAIDKALRKVNEIGFKRALKKLIFLENPDPLEIYSKLLQIKKENSKFIIVSKSGNTIETISIFKVVLDFFKMDLTKDSNKFIIISDKNTPLSNLALKHKIRSFEIPENVGGRFSVLSSVGAVPLILSGFRVEKIFQGAREFLERFWDQKELHLLQKAFFLVSNKNKISINALFAYSSFFDEFNKWYVQLWAESLGKIKKDQTRVGFTPVGLQGSIDQHSFLQLIMEGPKDKSITFIEIEKLPIDLKIPDILTSSLPKSSFVNNNSLLELLNQEAKATQKALESVNIPFDVITLKNLDEKSLGELIIYFELLTSAVGKLLEIDTYNQPGVELGKKILKERFSSKK